MADPSPTASLLTFVLGAVTLAPGARVKLRSDQQAEFDSRLHSHRVKTYCELWTLMEPLARYDREGTLDENGSWKFPSHCAPAISSRAASF
ncbi:MAG: hypothetical protein EOP58_09855 [Sphingomonadales bacterium]|nr:MAG: hypothetical protein EOP58_09855 [Sphingomonadales bacterium]